MSGGNFHVNRPVVSLFYCPMFEFLRNKNRPKLLQLALDAPTAGAQLSRPEIEVRGWAAFDRSFNLEALRVRLQVEDLDLPIPLEMRPDIEAGLPDQFCVGFNKLFDLQADILGKHADWYGQAILVLKWPGGEQEEPIRLELEPDLPNEDSYFYLKSANEKSAGRDDRHLDTWNNQGYVLLEGFYEADVMDQVNREIDLAWEKKASYTDAVTVDEYIGTGDERRIPLAEANPEIRSTPYKLNDLYLESGIVRNVVLGPALREMLAPLIHGTPIICNSLSFERGSQQQDHFDTFFMPPLTRNRMLATWVALEDVDPDAGPLRYYPGSHKIPPFRFAHGRYNLALDQKDECYAYIDEQLEALDLQPVVFEAKKGDVFVWHAHLLHGGLPINNPQLTRKSLVTHYFCREDWSDDFCEEYEPGCFYLKRDL